MSRAADIPAKPTEPVADLTPPWVKLNITEAKYHSMIRYVVELRKANPKKDKAWVERKVLIKYKSRLV